MLGVLLEPGGAFQQALSNDRHTGRLIQPAFLAEAVVLQSWQALKISRRCSAIALEAQHAECLIKGLQQACL